MPNQKTPDFSFSRRLGYTHYDVDVYCDPDAKVTYEDRLIELIRNNLLAENADAHNHTASDDNSAA